MSIFAKLKGILAEREKTASEAYRELVLTVAKDEGAVAEKQALAVLEASGRTASQFEADVQRERDKVVWRNQRLAGLDAKKKQDELARRWSAKCAEREAEHAAFTKKWAEAHTAYETESRQLDVIIGAGERAREQLVEACREPNLDALINEKVRQFQVARGTGSPRDGENGLVGNAGEERRLAAEIAELRAKFESAIAVA